MKISNFKLGIGLPTIESKVALQFMTSFITLQAPDYTLLLPSFPLGNFPREITMVRNNLVRQAFDDRCSHLLMMDTDQAYYTQDMIPKMLAHKVPVVSAPVHRRYPPFDPILLRGDADTFTRIPDEEAYSGGLIKVDATGTGCILYEMSVFETIRGPWFEFKESKSGKTIGEDINFCIKMKEAGIPLYVDTSIVIGHLSMFEVNRDTHMFFKAIYGVK